MTVVVIKDGKVLRTFKDGHTYAEDDYFPPVGSYILWEDKWFVIKNSIHHDALKVPDVIKAIALLAQ